MTVRFAGDSSLHCVAVGMTPQLGRDRGGESGGEAAAFTSPPHKPEAPVIPTATQWREESPASRAVIGTATQWRKESSTNRVVIDYRAKRMNFPSDNLKCIHFSIYFLLVRIKG